MRFTPLNWLLTIDCYLPINLSIHHPFISDPSINLFINHPSVCPSFHLSFIHPQIHLSIIQQSTYSSSIHQSNHSTIDSCIHLFVHPHIPPIQRFIYLSVPASSTDPSICPSICQTVSLTSVCCVLIEITIKINHMPSAESVHLSWNTIIRNCEDNERFSYSCSCKQPGQERKWNFCEINILFCCNERQSVTSHWGWLRKITSIFYLLVVSKACGLTFILFLHNIQTWPQKRK